ncbi:MAG: hypothetical protein P1R58_00365 [bacterium]|nr:hypothetical protein [bacterium]
MNGLETWVGSLGVAILLVAFALNMMGKLSEQEKPYLTMNIIGALLAAYYAWAGGAIPFLILEVVWALAALFQLVVPNKKAPTN